MNGKAITRLFSITAILLATILIVPETFAQRGGGGGGGGQGGGGGRGGGSARSQGGGGGRSSSMSSSRSSRSTPSRSAIGGSTAGRSSSNVVRSSSGRSNAGQAAVRANVSSNVRVNPGTRPGNANINRPGNNNRPGYVNRPGNNNRPGYGRYGNFYGGFYGRYGNRFYNPWRIGFYGFPWYLGGGYSNSYASYATPYYTYYPYEDVMVDDVMAVPTETPQSEYDPQTTANGSDFLGQAQEAFRAGDYDEAVRLASHALVDAPQDGRAHTFTAQALFAVGDYEGAAAAIHQGASLLPDNDWGHFVENYRHYYQGRDFVDQMDRLNQFINENPDAAYAYFVRGFEHGFLGHSDMAIKDLRKAAELESRDELATRLVKHFGGEPATDGSPTRAAARAISPPSVDAETPPPPEAPQ